MKIKTNFSNKDKKNRVKQKINFMKGNNRLHHIYGIRLLNNKQIFDIGRIFKVFNLEERLVKGLFQFNLFLYLFLDIEENIKVSNDRKEIAKNALKSFVLNFLRKIKNKQSRKDFKIVKKGDLDKIFFDYSFYKKIQKDKIIVNNLNKFNILFTEIRDIFITRFGLHFAKKDNVLKLPVVEINYDNFYLKDNQDFFTKSLSLNLEIDLERFKIHLTLTKGDIEKEGEIIYEEELINIDQILKEIIKKINNEIIEEDAKEIEVVFNNFKIIEKILNKNFLDFYKKKKCKKDLNQIKILKFKLNDLINKNKLYLLSLTDYGKFAALNYVYGIYFTEKVIVKNKELFFKNLNCLINYLKTIDFFFEGLKKDYNLDYLKMLLEIKHKNRKREIITDIYI